MDYFPQMTANKRVALLCCLFYGQLFLLQTWCAGAKSNDHFVACGSSKRVVSAGGRIYEKDDAVIRTTANTFPVSKGGIEENGLFSSARFFTASTKYSFNLTKPGLYWVRLYFHPNFTRNSFKEFLELNSAAEPSFKVLAGEYVLMEGFTMNNDPNKFMRKEFLINVESTVLLIEFRPSKDSVAFVNAIDVVAAPLGLFRDKRLAVLGNNNKGVAGLRNYLMGFAGFQNYFKSLVGFGNYENGFMGFGNYTKGSEGFRDKAMETVFRVNVGGQRIESEGDQFGRIWENDRRFLNSQNASRSVSVNPRLIDFDSELKKEIAPDLVYASAQAMGDFGTNYKVSNISWKFDVETNSSYFVRMHFCDIIGGSPHSIVFNSYVNSENALTDLDVSTEAEGLKKPFHYDVVVNVGDEGEIRVDIGLRSNWIGKSDAFLNGLEIMRLIETSKSANEIFQGPTFFSRLKVIFIFIGIVGGVVLGFLFGAFVFFRPRENKDGKGENLWLPLSLHRHQATMVASKLSTLSVKIGNHASSGKNFSFAEIQEATRNFDEELVIGLGGFGKVYRGELKDGTKVAIKRGNPNSKQGLTEFQTEIEMLSKLRHKHLVSLIGYCEEHCEMILVYDYMASGSLKGHLYGTELPALSWKQRLEICIGAARGIHYLHNETAYPIIHRDVKTANILLDENFLAKVADFGLSKTGPTLDQTHVSTAVKGSFGYLDPEYFRRQQLTEKSDVYSFGVVMMEVLCARPAIDSSLPREEVNIVEWSMNSLKTGILEHVIDPYLAGKVSPASVRVFGEIVEKCVAEQGIERPTMGDVLRNLEYVLQLQETFMQNNHEEEVDTTLARISLLTSHITHVEPCDDASVVNETNERASDVGNDNIDTNVVFSPLEGSPRRSLLHNRQSLYRRSTSL